MLKRFFKNKDGVAAVDFALVSMVFIVCVLGVIEFGRVFFIRGQLSYAADTMMREVLMTTKADGTGTSSNADLLTTAKSALGTGMDMDKLTVQVGTEDIDGVTYQTLILSYSMSLVIPGFTDAVTMKQFRRSPVM